MQPAPELDRPFPPTLRNASAVTLLSFHWMTDTVSTGRLRSLEHEDILPLADRFRTRQTGHSTFQPLWKHENDRAHGSLLRTLFRAFGKRLLLGGLLKAANDVCIFVSPMLLRLIIQHLQERDAGAHAPLHGLGLAFALFITYSCQSLVFNQYFNIISTVQVQLRGALVSAVFEKSCRLSPESRASYTSGQIQNLMSTDSRTVADVVLYIHMLWSAFEQILVAMTLLVNLMGALPTFAGILFIIATMPLQGMLVAAIKSLREKASSRTDERVKNVAEAIKGIKLVKLYAWELSFVKRILGARARELEYLRKMSLTQAWSTTIVSSLPTMLTIVVFTAYAATGRTLNAAVVFPAIALFNVIRPPLLFFPNTIINAARAAASLSRLEKFLKAEELTPISDGPHALDQESMEAAEIDLASENASFAWDPSISLSAPTLSAVSFSVPRGSLVAVVGPTGGGKSSLLAGLLGELPIIAGKIGVRRGRSVAFCDQVPFIQNATVRDNILFGMPFDEGHYHRTVKACCLLSDFKLLPAGDLTEIGGRGVNLSGGQRARVSLARAVYSRADICLLDDPLSAVDAHVGKSIFKDCIVSMLQGKTRMLTTNHVHFAASSDVDYVAVVSHGTVLEFGKRKDLLADPNSEFARLVEAAGEMGTGDIEESPTEDIEAEETNLGHREDINGHSGVIDATGSIKKAPLSTDKGVLDKSETESLLDSNTMAKYGTVEAGKLTKRETKEKGRVEVKHYISYFISMGVWQWVVPIFLFALTSQLCTLGVNVWLSVWSEESMAADRHDRTAFNLAVFCVLGLFAVAVASGSAFSLAFGTIRASVVIHEKLLFSVFGAPSSFFNSTPEGRLVNRFNSDMDKVDSTLGPTMQSLLRLLLGLSFTLGLILWATPAFIFFVIPVAAICLYVQEFYRKSSVDLRRLEALARSPLYSHFGETLDGVVTIRAYGVVTRATHISDLYTDMLNKTTYASSSANRWISVRLESLGTVLIFGATILALFAPPGQLSASMSGLVLSYVMQILGGMTWSVRQFTETESQMSAIERVAEYSQPPFKQEEPGGLESFLEEQELSSRDEMSLDSKGLISEEKLVQLQHSMRARRSRWPKKGRVEFIDVEMRYRADLAPALQAVSFVVEPGEHVGIVGRTGAGKSSAIQCLFRLYELQGGRIVIDGVDIATLRLFDLRSSLGIIPQEPVCFSGTVRSNLDMFGEHDESSVREALVACGLQATMAEKVDLDYVIAEGGSNLSVGQRQLLCLGRALLRDSQVLVLDEATSSVSQETDAQIQQTLREEMGHCTVLTVAHRLHTVVQCDRIIVMERGQVAEMGRPAELLERGGMFTDLVNETGASTAAHLKYLASVPREGTTNASDNKRDTKASAVRDGIGVGRCREGGWNISLSRRVRQAFHEMRSALLEARSAGTEAALAEENVDGGEWREMLCVMVDKLNVLSENLGTERTGSSDRSSHVTGEAAQEVVVGGGPEGSGMPGREKRDSDENLHFRDLSGQRGRM